MPQINIDSVGTQGVVRDKEAYTLDPVAWNELLNMRCLDGGIYTIPQCTQVFGVLPDVPAFLMPVVTNTETFWLWTSLTDAYVWDGSEHHLMTRIEGPYTTSFKYEWNGINFAGIPVANNGVDVPQYWSPLIIGDPIPVLDFTKTDTELFESATSQSSRTFSNVFFDQPDPERRLIIFLSCLRTTTSDPGLPTMTAGGVAMTRVVSVGEVQGGLGHRSAVFIGHVPNGSTGDVVITIPNTANRWVITVLRLLGPIAVETNGTTTTDAGTVPIATTVKTLTAAVGTSGPITDDTSIVGVTMVEQNLTQGSFHRCSFGAEIIDAGSYNVSSVAADMLAVVALKIDLAAVPEEGRLRNMTNWPATTRAKVVRALGPFLVAFNVVEAGNSRPHAILWSHPADPGSLPVSWDYTDPTRDAGINELPDVDSGVIKDALPLRGQMIIYKERATWRMRHVGGRSIFAFDSLFDTSGIMAARCVSLVPDGMRHFVASKDDLVQHNGQELRSVVNRRMQRVVFNNIDLDNADAAFTFADPVNKECWFCYPELGNPTANRAIIWNYDSNALSEAEVDFNGVFFGPNNIGQGTRVWDAVASEWDIDPHRWDPTSHSVLIATHNDGHFCVLNTGRSPRVTANRIGLAIVGQKRDKSAIVDYNARKLVTRVWPRVKGGDEVFIRLGAQELVDGEVTWTAPKSFRPKTDQYIDFIVEGRAVAIEFSGLRGGLNWGLEGYKLDMEVIAEF